MYASTASASPKRTQYGRPRRHGVLAGRGYSCSQRSAGDLQMLQRSAGDLQMLLRGLFLAHLTGGKLLLPPMMTHRRHGVLAGAQQEIDGRPSDGTLSVSGTVYSAGDDAPTVQLFTKAGCTLCDVAKGVLASASAEQPHTLVAVDITDEDKTAWWDKYKYDIPVLHINNVYWAKHRIELDATLQALAAAKAGALEASKGEPDAGRMERK
eukprot:CAMPEP_0118825030 /NCGR_PEP_ID=MMETSP1162-20130426/11008_1 /TAXON_ID=33656 /ORGANISM="Phaeocystis Sp, Strain CCMP2710" /LENGTH=209 /DNA_ID=CAMNT_0006755681 /DNA_START=27 /DNA_END=656 /DNA_ORIENTATION=+